jgi:hypothetical protein
MAQHNAIRKRLCASAAIEWTWMSAQSAKARESI